jgi:hypothetical protein
MPNITMGMSAPLAGLWNRFLRERRLDAGAGDEFDAASKAGTEGFQLWLRQQFPARAKQIQVDGHPGNQTFGFACGMSRTDWMTPAAIANSVGVAYPARSPELPQASLRLQEDLFGVIDWEPAPTPTEKERIRVTNDFVAQHIVSIRIPQLAGMPGASASGRVQAHKSIAPQLAALWRAWESQGIAGLIKGFGGLWNLRLVRGGAELSNHAWGTAFDVNVSANYLSHLPAFPGENGCLFKHVPIAQDYGFGWGGHYAGRLDGMHFEARRILSSEEITAADARHGPR